MKGSTVKRCPCPVRRDGGGRRMACGKPHGSWSYVVDVAATNGQKRRQISKGGFATRKAAETALSEFLTQATRGDVAVGGRSSLGEYLAEWLTGMRLSLAVSAWTNYRSILELYVQPRIGHIRLSALRGSTLTALYGELLAGGGKGGRALSPTTVRLVHRVLTKALNDAVESRQLAANPAQYAKVPARRRIEMRTWTAEQAETFLRSAAGDRLYAVWLLALACGLRRGELAGLRWADVDLEQRTLSVVSQRTTDADWQIVTKEPKGTSRRTIDLGGEALGALRAHRRQSVSERLVWGSAYTDTGLVFVREDGTGYSPVPSRRPVPVPGPRRGRPGDPVARRAALLRDTGPRRRHSPEGGAAAARPRVLVHHDGPLHPSSRPAPKRRLSADRIRTVRRCR